MDMRKCSAENLGKNYVGNMALFSSTEVAVADCTSLLPMALALTTTLSAVDNEWLTERLASLSQLDKSSHLVPSFTTRNGPDLFITSAQRFDMGWDWGIPGTSDGRPSAIRMPGITDPMREGGMIVLPRREEEGRDYEVQTTLEEGDMERLLKGLGNLVTRVVDAWRE